MIVATCKVFGHLTLCIAVFFGDRIEPDTQKGLKTPRHEQTLGGDDVELQASHEAIAPEPAEEDGCQNRRVGWYERERIRWTRYYVDPRCCGTIVRIYYTYECRGFKVSRDLSQVYVSLPESGQGLDSKPYRQSGALQSQGYIDST